MSRLDNIPQFKKTFWKKIGDEIVDRVRMQTQIDGKDVYNKKFKKYSPGYAELKPKLKRGGDTGGKVNLTLTGDMMNGLQTRGFTNQSVVLGWSGANAQKIKWNSEMGRTVTTKSKPIPDKVERYALNELKREVKKNIKQQTSKPIVYTIGKR